jgi:hypothetical protein
VHVLAYGRVAATEPFERQLELLAREHAVVPAGRVLDVLEGGRPLPAHSVLLLFHDEPSFARVAWPVLRRFELAAALFVDRSRTRSEELRELARQGVALGLAGERTGAGHADRVRELRRALGELGRGEPLMPRLYAYAGGRQDGHEDDGDEDDAEVERVRAAGFELAFTARAGANDLGRVDPLRLRSIQVDGAAPLEAFRALLELGSPERSRPGDPVEPLTPGELRSARAFRARRLRLRFVERTQDAVLSAGARPRPPLLATLRALTRRSSHYERLRNLVDLTTRPVPALERRLRRALVDTTRLPLAVSGVELAGHGTAATVFRLLGEPDGARHVLKAYRWTLGQPAAELVRMSRRHRARHGLLRQALGESVLAAHFLVLAGPLRALPVAACLQERVDGASDLLARTDEELLRLCSSRPELGAELAAFARRVLTLRARGFFPDLLGAGNLVLVERADGPRIRLIDYGIYDLRSSAPGEPVAALRACERRLERLVRALERGSSR